MKTLPLAQPKIQRLAIYLIKPSQYDDDGYVVRYWRGLLPSNTLACLHGLTEDIRQREALGPLQWKVTLIDETLERVNLKKIFRAARDPRTKVVTCLVGVQSCQFARASDLALQLRAGGVDVLIGGFHVSGSIAMLPQIPTEIQRLIDAGVTVVAGEIEGRWEGILRDLLEGKRKPVYNFLGSPPDLRCAPMPKVGERYRKRFLAPNLGTLDCGRGCPFACSFCTVINVQGRKMRFREVERLVELVRDNYHSRKISYYFFSDDNFFRNRHWEAIFDALIRLHKEEGIKLSFMIQVDTQSYKSPRFIEKAKAAGCTQVFLGVESLNPDNLVAAEKRQNRAEEFGEAIRTYRAGGINTHVAYIIGFPFDTKESVRRDIETLKSTLAPDQVSFFMLTPLPGSKDHAELVRQGIYMEPDFNRYDTCHVTTEHPRMTQEEWRGAYEEARTSFYDIENMKAILRRVSAENYWKVFANLLWHKNAIVVEQGHAMIHGLFRLRHRLERRPGWPMEGRWQYCKRRFRDCRTFVKRWIGLLFELEELWLQTHPRKDVERLVVEHLSKRYADVLQWRQLRQRQLQWAYQRAVAFARRRKACAQHMVRRGQRVPSRLWLWLKQRNPFSTSLTWSRKPFERFWEEAGTSLRRGRLYRLNPLKLIWRFAEESYLFATFVFACTCQLTTHLFGRAAESYRGSV